MRDEGGAPELLKDVGEFGLIRLISSRLPPSREVPVGPGDDAAIVLAGDGRVVATTDLLIEGRHFRLDWSSAYDIGRKAAAQNLADVAAMGGRPTALLVGLAAPGDLPTSWALQFTDGLRDECAITGAAVVGGDVSGSDTIMLGITALGMLDGRMPVLRSGARAGDAVVVAGRLGWAEAGLALLRQGLGAPAEVIAAHRRPEPPYRLGVELALAGADAMCDVSDGLLQDLGHIAAASAVRIDVDTAALPLPGPIRQAAARLDVDPLEWVLTGGDDHALAACLPPDAEPPAGCRTIGRVARGTGVTVDGRPHTGSGGHDHYG